jgi:glycosyltransferase involved in cell wall biosynthesis
VFFEALALIKKELANVTVLCLGMEGEEEAIRLVSENGLRGMVRLLPKVPHHGMGEYFRSSDITVSLSVHDGTPNSLLEAMACGCFPVVGDIESTREWINDSQNGLLVDATDAPSVAYALQKAIADYALRDKAFAYNQAIIRERASRASVMRAAEVFYREVLEWKSFVPNLR